METKVLVKASAIADLVRLASEINDRVESIELMGNKTFTNSLKKSKEQIKKRDFADWNAI